MGAAADINHAPFASDIARVKFSFSRVRLTFSQTTSSIQLHFCTRWTTSRGLCGRAETSLRNEFDRRKLMVIGDKAAFRHRHIDTVNLLTIRCVVISDTARSELWQEAIASNKDVDGSAGYPATPIATG